MFLVTQGGLRCSPMIQLEKTLLVVDVALLLGKESCRLGLSAVLTNDNVRSILIYVSSLLAIV